jgi:hypothetical protein
MAAIMPVGPAPAIKTGFKLSLMPCTSNASLKGKRHAKAELSVVDS